MQRGSAAAMPETPASPIPFPGSLCVCASVDFSGQVGIAFRRSGCARVSGPVRARFLGGSAPDSWAVPHPIPGGSALDSGLDSSRIRNGLERGTCPRKRPLESLVLSFPSSCPPPSLFSSLSLSLSFSLFDRRTGSCGRRARPRGTRRCAWRRPRRPRCPSSCVYRGAIKKRNGIIIKQGEARREGRGKRGERGQRTRGCGRGR